MFVVSLWAMLLLLSAPLAAYEDDSSKASLTDRAVRQIDNFIESGWEAQGLRPSPAATDGQWCRRVFLDVIGRVPTVEELREFLSDRSADRRRRLIERLLYDERYVEEFARNWSTVWANLLIGRTGGLQRGSMADREGMRLYLTAAIAENKPYDQMVLELLTATGSPSPDAPDFNGATNFLIDKVNEENATLATASTSRIFLGMQVQCTQCHNHPFNDWRQEKYWEMNAFFRQVRALRPPRDAVDMAAAAQLVDRDFRGEGGDIDEADVFYELRNGVLRVAYPVFIDGTEIGRSGRVAEVNRRRELAQMVIASPDLERAVVNRLWAHFLGYGFVRPVDDFGPHNPPSHPELLQYLADELRLNQFDLRQLIEWIVLSRPYQLASVMTRGNSADDPEAGTAPGFSRFYMRQMRAEELYQSLLTATAADHSPGALQEQQRRRAQWLQQFTVAFGNDEGDETTSFAGTIPQVLMMFNSELIREALSDQPGSLIDRLASDPRMRDVDRIHYLFQAGLARRATAEELRVAQAFFTARRGNLRHALQDVWWVVLNSNEFIFNY